jgi:hypothetical protein
VRRDTILANLTNSAIRVGIGATNRLVGDCTGINESLLQFAVNGVMVGSATDKLSATTGNVIYGYTGLRVRTVDQAPTEARFDNFSMKVHARLAECRSLGEPRCEAQPLTV